MNGYGFLLQAMKTVSLQGKTIAYKAGLCKMLSNDPNDQECEATADDQRNEAGKQNVFKILINKTNS